MSDRLQDFDYRSSPYHRPNQNWVCGRQAQGDCCRLGPDARGHCGAGPQCEPVRDGDRWRCTRPDLRGGPCAAGPAPDGRCACIPPPCRPRRSWRARRRILVRSVLVASFGLVLLGLSGTWAGYMVQPGQLSAAHAAIGECSQCHAVSADKASGWLGAAFGRQHHMASGDSQSCLHCHSVGAEPLKPHSLPAGALQNVAAGETGAGTWPVELNRKLFPAAQDDIACGSCHREHAGNQVDLTALADNRCQVCHTQRFGSFSKGHPAFSDYPYDRRTHIVFDHVSHISKYFPDEPDLAPETCSTCHVPSTDGRTMNVRDFGETCAACHNSDIDGDKLAGTKGLAGIGVPGMDLRSLPGLGEWPEFADGDITAMTDLLMRSDPDYQAARRTLADVDVLDMEDATAAQKDAATTLAWRFKALLHELQTQGTPALAARIEQTLGHPLSPDEQRRLTGLLPAALFDSAQRSWFPDLDAELKAQQAGETPNTVALRPEVSAGPEPASEPAPSSEVDLDEFDDLFADDGGGLGADDELAEDDDLFGDSLFGGDDDVGDPFAPIEAEASAVAAPAGKSSEERMALGGWYRDEFTLRYRPGGHADPVVRAWLDLAATHPGLDEWLDPQAPGACTQCHSIDAVTTMHADAPPSVVRMVQWKPRAAVSYEHHFTEFDHSKHFSMVGDSGCTTCHRLDAEAPYAESFDDQDPHSFASNFTPIEQTVCLDCHQAERAGDNCTQCHRYHIGNFSPTLPPTAMTRQE
ncbi:MAG: hypothetical protein VX836_03585 [Pseudomonadota bacterium]|nr:hypothetical protein [Pseudomonadota bacterium]